MSCVRRVSLLVITLGAGCATAPDEAMRERARQHLLSSKECPENRIVDEDREDLRFVVAGCNRVAFQRVECDRAACQTEVVIASEFARPQRLQASDGGVWVAPGAERVARRPGDTSRSFTVEEHTGKLEKGKRLTDPFAPGVAPRLPLAMARPGFNLRGLYRVCTDAQGSVFQVDVVQSVLPGGLDGHYISSIEKWKYQPHRVDGRPVATCFMERIDVATR